MTDDQKKMLTEKLLKECWHEPIWHDLRGTICSKCDEGLNGIFDMHRTFLTWQDLGDCKEALVKEGLWYDFTEYTEDTFAKEFECYKMGHPSICDLCSKYIAWLFRPIDEKGEPHFCRLVAEFMEAKV